MKCVLLIVDGMGDLPIPALGGLTPLESAHTPNLDKMASAGLYGLVDPVAPGVEAHTHSGAGMILGLLPDQTVSLRRGAVEAAGLGLPLREGDVALRANFATVEGRPGGFLIQDRRAGRISANTAELASLFEAFDLADEVTASLHATEQHRAVLVLSGPGLDDAVSDTDPGDIPMPAPMASCLPERPSAEKTASKINGFISAAHERLNNHPSNRRRREQGKPPANGVITRGAGSVNGFHGVLTEKGLGAAMVTGCNTVRGLARMLGFDVISQPGFTADRDTDLDAKVHAAISALHDHDIVYVHIKAPDICAHDRQPIAKRDFLERMDAALAPLMDGETVIAVTADHTTDSNTGFHTADPVPALLFVPTKITHGSEVAFGESACARGNMERQIGGDFLARVLATIVAGA